MFGWGLRMELITGFKSEKYEDRPSFDMKICQVSVGSQFQMENEGAVEWVLSHAGDDTFREGAAAHEILVDGKHGG